MDSYITFIRWFTLIAALAFLISGLDDLFVDVYYYCWRLYRRFTADRRYRKLTEEDLRTVPEKLTAIMIPAWDEGGVIRRMIENTLRSVDYRNYEIFAGTYPNDEGTTLDVAAVEESDNRVHRVVCPHDGPTNKGDCLNWVYQGILLYEKKVGRRFEIFAIHDSEDIIHPLTLKLMNYLIPRIHMVQLPVTPLEMPLGDMTAGTYLDEFAEFHAKDLLVRERLCRMIPSAGVGTGFSRECLEELAGTHQNQLFNVETLTEDYDLGFRLYALKKKSILVLFSIERVRVVQKGWFEKREALERFRELVATREFFPTRFSDAVRQKSRWIVGIVFQGWRQLGWVGNRRMVYMLWRDRKPLISHLINIYGYFVVLVIVAVSLRLGLTAREAAAAAVSRGNWLWYVLVIDSLLMLHRWVQRIIFVAAVSNWKQAVLSVPRVVWGNLINFWSVAKATQQFAQSVRTGERVAWTKTRHAYPDQEQLLTFKRKLGDLLLENRMLSLAQLSDAVEVQKQTGERLGDLLVRLGYVREEELMPVLAGQLGIQTRSVDAKLARQPLVKLIPEREARKYVMMVVGSEEGVMIIGAADPGNPDMKKWLEENFKYPHRVTLVGRANLTAAFERAYPPLERKRPLLGGMLLQTGVITSDQLSRALEEQKRTGKRLGEVLEELGMISPDVLAAKLHEQQASASTGVEGGPEAMPVARQQVPPSTAKVAETDKSEADRRKHHRVRLGMPLQLRDSLGMVEFAKAENVSEGGFCFVSEKTYEIGESLVVSCPYEPGGLNIEISAIITSRRREPDPKVMIYDVRYT